MAAGAEVTDMRSAGEDHAHNRYRNPYRLKKSRTLATQKSGNDWDKDRRTGNRCDDAHRPSGKAPVEQHDAD